MTKEQILNSISLKKRFCKDCNLPISVFDNPYFYERLYALDILFDCIEKFDLFCSELFRFPDEQSYFEYYNIVKDKMISDIKGNQTYQMFNTDSSGKAETTLNILKAKVGKKNLYVDNNDHKTFISIDMKKANFSAMNFYSRDIFNGSDTWEEYVGKFTDSKHISNSKYIRQVVLGDCNPKRQIQYEHSLMLKLYLYIKDILNNNEFTAYSIGEDEILIEVARFPYSLNKLKKVIASCPLGIGNLVRVEMFDLQKAGDYGWLKIIYGDNNAVKFKCIDAEIFHQVVKHYYNIPITENDLVFRHNSGLARFLEEVKNPWQIK